MGLLSELSSSRKKLHPHFLYFLLGIQFTYIVVDQLAYHYSDHPLLACVCSCPCALTSASTIVRGGARHQVGAAHSKRGICTRREDYYDYDYNADVATRSGSPHKKSVNAANDREAKEGKGGNDQEIAEEEDGAPGASAWKARGPDAWHQMKWVGQPASCPVKGQLIEKLDEESNFRRGYALQFVEDVEDKTHLLPWLLASKLNLNRRKRRVYIDLGANRFTTSVRWFLRMYPCDFTEIHAFEVNPRSWRPPKVAFNEEDNLLAPMPNNNSLLVKKKPGIPEWMLERIHIHYKLASHRDDDEKGLVNMTRFIKEELNLKREDAVVVKMDIEGSEWPLLKAWMEDPEMPLIVDELFVEVHYAHPSMSAFGWDAFTPITRQDARHLIGDLRWKGFYVHAWP